MITQPTVLILGAGASKPYGFPLGKELFARVWKSLQQSRNEAPMRTLLYECEISPEDMDKFAFYLKHSQRLSVDEFLEHNPDLSQIGKLAIAYDLLTCETNSQLFDETDQKESEGDWYRYLFHKMNSKLDDFGGNKLSIVTYNYDRSLRHYLLNALAFSYSMQTVEAEYQLQNIPIIHLHGQLGTAMYQNPVHRGIVKKAADDIKIVHTLVDVNADPQFKRAHQLLSKAEIICFLGFGYLQTNLDRLNIQKWPVNAKIFGSGYGLTRAEMLQIHAKFPYGIHFGEPSWNTLQCLREWAIFPWN